MIYNHNFTCLEKQAAALADAVAKKLIVELSTKPLERITLAVSGGKTPDLFFRKLSNEILEWSRINITLVDDRWVNISNIDSNEKKLRELFWKNEALSLYSSIIPLVDLSKVPEEHAKMMNCTNIPAQPNVVVLGMGKDGHIASLFADAPEWPIAIKTFNRWITIHPYSAPYTRISMSLKALASVKYIFLQIIGDEKLLVLKQAQHSPSENAISKLITENNCNIHVYSAV